VSAAIVAEAIVDGVAWRAELVPLESIRIWHGEAEIRHPTWDRQTLGTLFGTPVPHALTLAMREAISATERRPPTAPPPPLPARP
jgi:hypothetical protein